MPLTTIRSPPALDSFTSLADHQSQTPTSFFGAKPVLHHCIVGARALVQADQASKLPIFSASEGLAHHGNIGTESEVIAGETKSLTVAVVDVFVSSE